MSLTDELVLWTHEQKCLKAVAALQKNGFGAEYCATPHEAFECIVRESADAASVGFGGSCFKKDILNLVYLCEYYGLAEVANYWEQVVRMNDYQQARFVSNMLSAMFNTVSGKRIALFGVAFKANTSDTRDSPALKVCRALLEEHAEIVLTDSHALDGARIDLGPDARRIIFEPDPYAAAAGAHAIAILTEWPSFTTLDYEAIFASMAKPAFIFDGRNILDHSRLYEYGFNVYAVGKPPRVHSR